MPLYPGARVSAIAVAILVLHGAAHPLAQAQEIPAATVKGVVKNRLTGEPIARALVDCPFDGMLTDSEGRFELHIPTGSMALEVRRPGYTSGKQNSGGHRLRVEGDMSGLVFYLTPTASIAGHVSTTDGSDPTGMTFLAYRRHTLNGRPQWLQAGFAAVDSEGAFSFYDMDSPGDYVVCNHLFRERTMGFRPGKPIRGFPAQCYPADPGDSADNLLHLAPGQQAQVEITRTLQPFFPVKIAAPNHPQGLPGSFQIYTPTGIPLGAPFQWNTETNSVTFDLPSGSYRAEGRTYAEPGTFGRVDFRVESASPASASLVESPLAPVVVQVRKDFTAKTDQQAPQVFIGNPDAPPAYLNLVPVDSMTGGGGGARPIRHAEGTPSDQWELEGMTPGRYWVVVTPSMQGYVSAITSGGVDLAREPLTIGPGNTVAPIEISFRNDTGQIDCTISGQATRPTSSATAFSTSWGNEGPNLWAIPAGTRLSRLTRANGMPGERVTIGNLAPGRYHVLAFDDDRDLETADEEELRRLEEKGTTVTVPAGGTVTVQLDLIKSDEEESTP